MEAYGEVEDPVGDIICAAAEGLGRSYRMGARAIRRTGN
jgi:hypothetical protein